MNGVDQVPFLGGARDEAILDPCEDISALLEFRIGRAKRIDSLGQDATMQKETRRVWELDTPPSTRPAYDAFIVDTDEHLWVRRYPAAGKDNTPWIVFSPDGVHVATVVMSAALTVYEVGQDYVSGIVRDPDSGRHAVVVLSLNRFAAH